MADTKISGLAALGAAPAIGDLLTIVDISDTTMAASGTNKYLTVTNLFTTPIIETLYGSSAANGDITIEGTSHATKTSSYVILQSTGGNVGIGNTAPSNPLQVTAALSSVRISSSTVTNTAYLDIGDSSNTNGRFLLGRESSIGGQLLSSSIAYAAVLSTLGAIPMQFGTNDAVAMTIDSAQDVGIGTANPTSKLHIVAGTLTDLLPGLNFTATLPATATGTNSGAKLSITSAGSSAQELDGLRVELLAGYTGGSYTIASYVSNAVAGTGASAIGTGGVGNYGTYSTMIVTTTGDNVGAYYEARGGGRNVGMHGVATTAKDSATNIGVMGLGRNTGATPKQLGGYFGFNATAPTFTSAALMCDNSDQTDPIFVARDNGTAVFTIGDGGLTTFADAVNVAFNGTTGTKLGTATTQKIGLWNTAPIVQPTTGVAAATFVANTSLIANDSATFDGYTIGQVVKALRNFGVLA